MASIIYAIIYRNPDTVLCHYSKAKGSISTTTRIIIKKVPKNGRFSFSYNESFVYHYISENNFIFMCLSDAEFNRQGAFLFLEDIKSKFFAEYRKIANLIVAFGNDSHFVSMIKDRMDYFNTSKKITKLSALKETVEQTKNIILENIDEVLEREDRDLLFVEKTEHMNEQAVSTKNRTLLVKGKLWAQNLKIYAICGFLVILFLLMVVGSVFFS